MSDSESSSVVTLEHAATNRIFRADPNLATVGLPFAVTGLGCALVLFGSMSRPRSAPRTLLMVSTVRCAVRFAAIVTLENCGRRRGPERRRRLLLCSASRLTRQRDGLGLNGAL
jgi:hypothetical protein